MPYTVAPRARLVATVSPSPPRRTPLRRSTTLTSDMEFLSAVGRSAGVYFTALHVFYNVKKTQWRETSLKKRLGLALDDEDVRHPELDALWNDTHERNAKVISESIVDLKGLWIKAGQYLSSRPDIVPLPFILHFRRLQDALPFRPWSEIDATLKSSLGSSYMDQYFTEIVKEPMSCASIAQVHRAKLKTGEEVVVKARHRDVERLMKSDLSNLTTLCNWIAWLNADYDFRKIVKEWIPAIKEELDLRNEAKSLQEVRAQLEEAGIRVLVPKIPNSALVKSDVLVMEYCKGFSVGQVDAYEAHRVDKRALMDRICTAWAVQMHTHGVFNADPHPGNILVSTDVEQNGGDPSVPVLLDFGLTRRFDPTIKVAFARMVHACYVMDVDGLLRAFEDMGLKIREQDPFQDIVSLRTAFQTVPASEAKAEKDQRRKEYNSKQKASPRTKRPVDAWPGELVFFIRVIGLLKGLCSAMELRYPYLKTTASVARETLRAAVQQQDHAHGLFYPESHIQSSRLQNEIQQVLKGLADREELLGMQVAALHRGRFVIDVTAGTLGIADPRPVKPDTLFNVFSVTKGIAAYLLHRAIQESGASYDDPVSKYWPGFEANGKESCTLRHVLNHQAGLAGALPDVATLDEILDWSNMISFLRTAQPAHLPGDREEYHYLTFGFLVGGVLNGMTGKSIEQLIEDWIVKPLNLRDVLYVGLPKGVPEERLAVLHNGFLSTVGDGMLASFGAENGSPSRSTSGPKWEKFKGSEHLYNPTTFNMRQVREACIPSANGHMSARALAQFYSSMSSSRAHSIDLQPLLEAVEGSGVEQSSQYDGYLASNRGSYALGFRVYLFRRGRDGKTVYGLGHPGLGGSFGFVIPEEDFALGITQSYLTRDRSAVREILNRICAELDLTLVPETL